MPEQCEVRLTVYNIIGEEVATLVDDFQDPGRYRESFDASKLASGIYFYRIQAGNFIAVRKMLFIRWSFQSEIGWNAPNQNIFTFLQLVCIFYTILLQLTHYRRSNCRVFKKSLSCVKNSWHNQKKYVYLSTDNEYWISKHAKWCYYSAFDTGELKKNTMNNFQVTK